MLVFVLGTVALIYAWFLQPTSSATKGYSDFLNDFQQGKVLSVSQQDQTLTVDEGPAGKFSVVVPSILTQVYPDMQNAAKAGNRSLPSNVFKSEKAADTSWIGLAVTGLLPLILIIRFIFFMI